MSRCQNVRYHSYLNAKVPSIDVVAQEKVPGLGGVAADLEQLHQVVVLSVNVTTDGDGGIHLEHIRFLLKDFGTQLENRDRLLLSQPALAVEVLLEKVEVELIFRSVDPELVVPRGRRSRCLDVFYYV